MASEPLVVQAIHPYKKTNNDEVSVYKVLHVKLMFITESTSKLWVLFYPWNRNRSFLLTPSLKFLL